MMERIAEASPRLKARIAGIFFLLTILAGLFAQMFVSGRLVVGSDATATATIILMHRTLFQLGFALYLILALGLLGAASQILWFLVFGVNDQRWSEAMESNYT